MSLSASFLHRYSVILYIWISSLIFQGRFYLFYPWEYCSPVLMFCIMSSGQIVGSTRLMCRVISEIILWTSSHSLDWTLDWIYHIWLSLARWKCNVAEIRRWDKRFCTLRWNRRISLCVLNLLVCNDWAWDQRRIVDYQAASWMKKFESNHVSTTLFRPNLVSARTYELRCG